MSVAVAYQCINARGAIAHGRKTELIYGTGAVAGSSYASVDQVFSAFGGTKELHGVEEVKEELMENGPVVSTSFSPNDAFLKNNAIGKSNSCHQSSLLIVGWQQFSSGEVWIIQPLYHDGGHVSQVVFVAMRQFGIDFCCLSPKMALEHIPWQPGPYYDATVSKVNDEWLAWTGISVSVTSMSELDSLFKEIGATFFAGASSAVPHIITVRNKLKRGHSKRASLHSVKWNEAKKKFIIKFRFIE